MDTTPAIRLKSFLEHTGMTPSQFADSCGIPRPTLSQLLSGRNKKLSDQIVAPIHRRFPELSVLWLLFGEGDMLVVGSSDGDNKVSETTENDIINTSVFEVSDWEDPAPYGLKYDEISTQTPVNENDRNQQPSQNYQRTQGIDSRTDGNNGRGWQGGVMPTGVGISARNNASDAQMHVQLKARKVVRITVYYDDNTYESFQPQE